MKNEAIITFVRLQSPGIWDYLRDRLGRPACCFPCADQPADAGAGWDSAAAWYSDMGPGRNVALLCGHHKAIYEAELMKNRLPSREETELYIFDHTGPFLTDAQPPEMGWGRL